MFHRAIQINAKCGTSRTSDGESTAPRAFACAISHGLHRPAGIWHRYPVPADLRAKTQRRSHGRWTYPVILFADAVRLRTDSWPNLGQDRAPARDHARTAGLVDKLRNLRIRRLLQRTLDFAHGPRRLRGDDLDRDGLCCGQHQRGQARARNGDDRRRVRPGLRARPRNRRAAWSFESAYSRLRRGRTYFCEPDLCGDRATRIASAIDSSDDFAMAPIVRTRTYAAVPIDPASSVVALLDRIPWNVAMAGFETTFALLARRNFGYYAYGVGGLLAFAGIVQAVTQGYLIRKISSRAGELKLIRGGLVVFAIGMAPMASVASPAMLLVTLALLSLGYGFVSPSIASLISKRTEQFQQGEVLGLNQSSLALARICGPVAGGFVYQHLGAPATYVGGGMVAILALLLANGIKPDGETSEERPPR